MKIYTSAKKIKAGERNLIAKDLRTPKYRMRVVVSKKKKQPKHKERYDIS